MAPGCGNGKTLGSWRTGREVPRQLWWFPLQSLDDPEQDRKGLPVGENRKSNEISSVHPPRLFLFTPVLISLLNQPNLNQQADIYLFCRQALWAWDFSVIQLIFQAGKHLALLISPASPFSCDIYNLILKRKGRKKSFDYTRSFKK